MPRFSIGFGANLRPIHESLPSSSDDGKNVCRRCGAQLGSIDTPRFKNSDGSIKSPKINDSSCYDEPCADWLFDLKTIIVTKVDFCNSKKLGHDEYAHLFLQFDLKTIKVATNNFDSHNKIGEGGFDHVYKGVLSNGRNIAVKRVHTSSNQGVREFKNEIVSLAKVQHRNIVWLQGFCLEEREMLLVYEFIPKGSLDRFIYDPTMREHLNWERRYKILGGVARGLCYLHEESRFSIIHRDIKASNILLDGDLNAKITDFGLGFISANGRSQTDVIAGTVGYIAPEHLMHGELSVKMDVFSFGVLVLEVVCGRKNMLVKAIDHERFLLEYAWKSWREGTAFNIVDPMLRTAPRDEIIRCIHIGLLCCQYNVADRPTMASVVVMLGSNSVPLLEPSECGYSTDICVDFNSTSDESNSCFLQCNSLDSLGVESS